MREFKIPIEPFDFKLLVYYGETTHDVIEYHNSKYEPKIEPVNDAVRQFVNVAETDSGPAFCMVLAKDSYNDGLLVHECFHVIYYITKYVGMELTDSSQEYYAYAIQRLFDQIKKKLKKL